VGRSEIVVAGCGVPNLVKPEWVQEGAIVIDVGITYLQPSEIQQEILYDLPIQV
jgi:methylenetetrahydrofolate dehydrogenase (NADP+)/methenyltetrahydrofolate cyclohydrolase/formyltetrahydrofolate synthetase